MEKALGEMRQEIGKKDSYQTELDDLEKGWDSFRPQKEALGKFFEEIDSNQHLTNPATDQIIKGTKAVKNRIKAFNVEINSCTFFILWFLSFLKKIILRNIICHYVSNVWIFPFWKLAKTQRIWLNFGFSFGTMSNMFLINR